MVFRDDITETVVAKLHARTLAARRTVAIKMYRFDWRNYVITRARNLVTISQSFSNLARFVRVPYRLFREDSCGRGGIRYPRLVKFSFHLTVTNVRIVRSLI